MSRSCCFLFAFTIPSVKIYDDSGLLVHCLAVFLVAYGCLGLDLTAIGLDNPLGDDPNDFDSNTIAHMAYEDIHLTVMDVDGHVGVDKLRYQMNRFACGASEFALDAYVNEATPSTGNPAEIV